MMLCGVRVEWPLHFVEEQARIAKDPQLAQKELLFLNGRLHMVDSELKSLRTKTDKAERRRLTLERERDEERARARRAESSLKEAEFKVEQQERLRAVHEKQLSAMEMERDREKVRANHVQRQLSKLRAETKHRGAHAAFRKLTLHPTIAKRLAAACHPDKLPSELSEAGSEFFRFVQSIRERHGE